MEVSERIPKKIYYVWLGKNEKPEIFYKCRKSWEDKMPDYEITEINEDNFNLEWHLKKNKFFRECHRRRLWAYVSDYIRAVHLYEHGGIYADTDMEIVKDLTPLINNENIDFVSCLENTGSVGMGLFAVKPRSKVLSEILRVYEKDIWEREIFTMPSITSHVLKNKFNFKLHEKSGVDRNRGIYIYDREFFYPVPFTREEGKEYFPTENTYAVHWWNHSWKGEKPFIFLATKHLKGFRKYRELIRRYRKYIINDIILKKNKKNNNIN